MADSVKSPPTQLTTATAVVKPQPSVSVIMPCFNAAAYIRDSIESIVSQSYDGKIEILVIDDGSTDDSINIASSFAGVRVLTQANQGPAAARNLGLKEAKGDLVAFLDADDHWTPGSLSARVAVLEARSDVDVVFGNFTRWHPSAESEVPDQLPQPVQAATQDGWLYPEILLDPILHIITAVVRRSVLNTAGRFDPALRTGEDYDFWIRVAQKHRFARVPSVVARYRIHAGGTTRVPRPDHNEYAVVQRAIARHGLRGPNGRDLDGTLLKLRLHRLAFDHAYLHYWHGDAQIAAVNFRRAVKHYPWRAKAWGYAALATLKALAPSPRAVSAHDRGGSAA